MEPQAIYVLALALLTIVLLALEKAHLSILGVGLVIAVAVWPGLVPAREAVSGFANAAVVTIAALYIVGEGFLRTGAATLLAEKILARTGGREGLVILLVMAMAAAISAFISNTLVVITFLPVVTTICQKTGLCPSRLLIPVSFASILGGMCTLVGTSTNLLVSGALQERGLVLVPGRGEPGLGMFDTTLPGLVVVAAGFLYITLIGRHLLPKVPSLTSQIGGPGSREYVTEITVGTESKLIGRPIEEMRKEALAPEAGSKAARPLMLVRNETLHWPPFRNMKVKAHDILMASGRVQALTELQKSGGQDQDTYDPATMTFFELALTPSSSHIGLKVSEIALKNRYGAVVVALQRQGKHIRERLSELRLRSGDVILVFGTDKAKEMVRQSHEFNLIEGVADVIYRREKARAAMAVAAVVITLFVTGVVAPVIAALFGAMLMVLSGCLSLRQAHSAVNWPIIIFIGGTLALSKGLDHSGATAILARGIESGLGDFGPLALLAGLYLGSILLTEMLSNHAVAVIMTPIAVTIAVDAGLPPLPLVLAVALGASTSFANPMGYQTNLIVLGPGGYRFSDFIRIGLPLDILLGVVGVAALTWLHPF